MGHIIPLIPSSLSPDYTKYLRADRGTDFWMQRLFKTRQPYTVTCKWPFLKWYVSNHTPGSSSNKITIHWVNCIVNMKHPKKHLQNSSCLSLWGAGYFITYVCNYQVKALQNWERYTENGELASLSLALILCIHSTQAASQQFLYPAWDKSI